MGAGWEDCCSHKGLIVVRASIVIGEEPARSDVGVRETRREKKTSVSRNAGIERAYCTVAADPPLRFFHVALSIKDGTSARQVR